MFNKKQLATALLLAAITCFMAGFYVGFKPYVIIGADSWGIYSNRYDAGHINGMDLQKEFHQGQAIELLDKGADPMDVIYLTLDIND